MPVFIPLLFFLCGLFLPAIRAYRNFFLASSSLSFFLGVTCINYIYTHPDQVPVNYPWLLQNIDKNSPLDIAIWSLIPLFFNVLLPVLLSIKIRSLVPTAFVSAFAVKDAKPQGLQITLFLIVLISLLGYIYLSGGLQSALIEAWLIRRGISAADVTFAPVKLFLSALAFNCTAIWIIFAINNSTDQFGKIVYRHPLSPLFVAKILLNFKILVPVVFSVASALLMAGRGNTIQFVEVYIFFMAFKQSRLQLLFFYPFIHYSLASASEAYSYFRSFLLNAEQVFASSGSLVYEPPARIANDFLNDSVIFRVNIESHLLLGNVNVDIFRTGEYITNLVKGSYQLYSWDSSQPFALLDSFVSFMGVTGIPIAVLASAICIAIPDQIIRKKASFESDFVYISMLYISLNAIRSILISPGFGSIVLQSILLPFSILLIIFFCSRQYTPGYPQ